MKNTSKSSKLLSFIMAFLILLVSLPTYALASLVPEDTSQGVNEEQTEEASFAQGELVILEEDISLREENVKHFKLSNGTVKAVSYANAVHYLDREGNWIDIDNSLTLNGSEYTANNKQKIKFANKSGSNGLLSIKDGEYKIDFTPLNTNKVSVEIENPQENNSRKFDDVKKLNNIVSKATYKGIYEGIDLEYVLVGNNIKENIIVNKKQEEYTYSFEIKLSKLNATLENNMVVLTDSDTGEKVYEIPAPYMVDANGEYSDKVEYTLTKDSKWKYTFTVKADPEWINEEERQLPVKIDPTVIVNSNITDMNATFEYTKSSTGTVTSTMVDITDNGALIVGNFVNYLYDSIAFMKFDPLIQIPGGAKFIGANLSFYVYYFVENLEVDGLNLGIYQAMADWTSFTDRTISGNYSMFNDYCDASDVIGNIEITGNGAYNCDITELYNRWLSGASNNGFCLKGMNLPQNDNDSTTDEDIAAYIVASNGIEGFVSPSLEVSYTHLIGVEDYYAYAENTLGDVGKSYVNLYNGSLTYINHLTSIEVGPNLTYDIDMVYNSIEKTWRPSFAECVGFFSYSPEQLIWRDQDGTNHVFSPIIEKNNMGKYEMYQHQASGENILVTDPTVFYPEDDIDYVLIQTTNNEFILRDYDGNQKMFDSQGRLSKICDAQGNLIHFSYLNGKLSVIDCKTEDNELVAKSNFLYEDGNLSFVYNYATKLEISLHWDNYLSQISYNDIDNTKDNTIEVNYVESSDMIDKISDTLASKYLQYITYEDEKVSAIQLYGSNNTNNVILQNSIVYNSTSTTCNNSQTGSSIEYTFDGNGRDASITHDDSIPPDSSYYNIVYSQNIYNQGGNLIKYDVATGEIGYYNVIEQNVHFNLTNIVTDESSSTQVVSQTSKYPYQMVCEVKSHFSNSSVPSTGFLVGPNILIMAGHGIFKDVTNDGVFNPNFPTSVEIVTGYYSEEKKEYLSCGVTTCYMQKEYYYLRDGNLSERHQYDLAVCILDENVGTELGWFNLIVPNETIINEYIQVIGHISSNYMFHSKGEILSFQETIEYDMNTWGGMSGGPVMLNNSDYLVFAVHVAGYDNTDGGCARKIDPLIYRLINDLN